MPGWSLEWDRHTVGVSSGPVSQVTDHLPSGLVNRVNGRDKSDSTTYKFNLGPLVQRIEFHASNLEMWVRFLQGPPSISLCSTMDSTTHS